MKEIIERLHPKADVLLCRPATDADIEKCNNELIFKEIPSGYAEFLKICNGLHWGDRNDSGLCLEFWGTDQEVEMVNDTPVVMESMVMNNHYFFEQYGDNTIYDDNGDIYAVSDNKDRLYLGFSRSDVYLYNTAKNAYEVREKEDGCNYVKESYPTFAELFKAILGNKV
ncbi:hypothetical protein AGMMS50293_13760 [Spirochaetia bacterium]|nr:hypothetical protein AGMMS50293_13760 [Spirochaetia bacterium]